MNYRNIIGTYLVLLPGIVTAQTFGVGISVKASDTSIYFPYKINEELIFEPYISHRSNKVSGTNGSTTNTQNLIGFGLLTNKKVAEKTFFHYGGRLAYLKNKNTINAKFNILIPNNGETSGYQIEPLIGISYNVTNSIVLRGEASFFYSKTDGDTPDPISNQNSNIEKTDSGTVTRLLISYYF